jgi:hypothetical protein
MTTIIETGHAVNISNFKLLIDGCTAFGATYNPSNADLSIASMTLQWHAAETAHTTLTTALQNAKNPINQREALFEPLSKLVTRTLNYYRSTKATKQAKQDAKGLADKIRGHGIAVKKLDDGTPDPDDVSNSHMSYVQRTDNFRQLIDLYSSDPLYMPNEIDLQTDSLHALYVQMKSANDNIGTILAPVDAARIARDHALYDDDTGLLDLAAACKDYVQGLFGAISPEARTVTGIEFKRFKKIT